MTLEETLVEAKIRYPIGTEFKCIYNNDLHRVSKDLQIELNSHISHYGIGYVYKDGQWAEIISLPENNFNYNFY